MKTVIFKTNEAGAIDSGAMVADNHLTNGAKPKSLMSREIFKIFAIIVLVAGIVAVKACKKDGEDRVSQSVIEIVSVGGVLPETEGEVFLPREDIVGSGSVWVENTEPPPSWITRKSESNLECHIFNTLWRIDTVKISASENPEDFALFNPLAGVLWPGNLVQGTTLAGGVTASIPVAVSKRKPGNISLAIVSPAGNVGDPMYLKVDNMQFSTVNQAMNDVMRGFGGHGYAQYSFTFHTIESTQQLDFSLNASFSGYGASAKAGLSVSNEDKYTYILVRLHQAYYTLVYDDPAGLDGVFTPDITANDLRA